MGMGSSRRIEKCPQSGCPQSGWGCMGGGATDHHLEDHLHPVQLYVPGTVRTATQGTRQRKSERVWPRTKKKSDGTERCCQLIT